MNPALWWLVPKLSSNPESGVPSPEDGGFVVRRSRAKKAYLRKLQQRRLARQREEEMELSGGDGVLDD